MIICFQVCFKIYPLSEKCLNVLKNVIFKKLYLNIQSQFSSAVTISIKGR